KSYHARVLAVKSQTADQRKENEQRAGAVGHVASRVPLRLTLNGAPSHGRSDAGIRIALRRKRHSPGGGGSGCPNVDTCKQSRAANSVSVPLSHCVCHWDEDRRSAPCSIVRPVTSIARPVPL